MSDRLNVSVVIIGGPVVSVCVCIIYILYKW